MAIPVKDEKQLFDDLLAKEHSHLEEYYAFYSSWFGGIIKNPRMMLIPIDDHMVHRGDGIFEAIKAVSRSVYLLDEHLNRLFASAKEISLTSPVSFEEMKAIVIETIRVADVDDAVIRIYLSRGPGDFTVNPYDSVGAQIYVIISKLKSPSPEKYENGVSLGRSRIPAKPPWLAQIKTCNYLPNVLMKKEAVDRHLDYVLGVDEQGYITESATENIMIVDSNSILVHPPLETILQGTIMTRTCELARENDMVVEERPITLNDLQSAKEAMIAGTTLNILPAVKFEDHKINTGKPGQITTKLLELIQDDIKQGPRRTSY